jgi:ferredoxin-NADP reductase
MEYDEEGRIGVKLLKARLRFDDYDFYMCGPAGFMQSIYDGLRDLQVADGRIHAEAFGAPGLTRRQDASALRAPARTVATDPTRVAFVRSAKEAMDAQSRDIARPGRIARRRSAVVAEAAGRVPQRYCRAPSRTIVRRPSAFPKGRR